MARNKYIYPEPSEPVVEYCPLCERELAGQVNRHHLIPKSQGGAGTETLMMHKICHNKIHSILTEKELKQHYNTAEALRAHPELEAFIQWVRKRPADFYDNSVKAKR